MTSMLSFIMSRSPPSLGKVYALESDGRLTKQAVAQVTAGKVVCRNAPDAEALVRILAVVTERTDTAICPAIWGGNDGHDAFELVTQGRLAKLMHLPDSAPELGGVHELGGRRVGARLKRGMIPSNWVLIDCDDPPGMPEELKYLTLAGRLERLERCLPGISSCERVELRGNSARVRKEGEAASGPTHALLRISDAAKTDTLRHHLAVSTVERGLGFVSTTKGGAAVMRSVIDLSVFVVGRLIFCSRPNTTNAPGYLVDDANITIRNAGGGVLDVSTIELPSAPALARHRQATGETLRFTGTGAASTGLLTLTTPITRRGTVRTAGEWLADMVPGQSLRCEAPFRESVSEAGFIKRTETGGFVHDVGTATTYLLPRESGTQVLGSEGPRAVVAVGEAATRKAMQAFDCSYGLAAQNAEGLADVFVPKAARRVFVIGSTAAEIEPGRLLVAKLQRFRFKATLMIRKKRVGPDSNLASPTLDLGAVTGTTTLSAGPMESGNDRE